MKWAVIGAGSGGCVAARRLHDAGHEVVVIEAGPSLIHGSVPSAIDGDDSFAALKEPGRVYSDVVAVRTAGQPERPYLHGRGLGGSSTVNSMVALAGDHELYRTWGWNDTEPAVAKILVPFERPARNELGRVDRLILDASNVAQVVPLTRHLGRRITAAEAYLWPCESSERMDIVTEQVVDVVTFDRAHQRATGVRLASGVTVSADAVVLAAGSIHTPAILQRSHVNAPDVGEHLQDHPSAALTLQFRENAEPGDRVAGLSTATIIDADPIQILALNHLGAAVSNAFGMLLVALMRPQSRGGRVRLRSSDPNDAPFVEFDLLSDHRDLDRLRLGVRSAVEMLRRPPFSDVVANVLIDDRGTSVDELDDDEHLDRWLTDSAADYVHASSSCSRSVGLHGAVKGHDGLFVCDASAFPSIPNVNTHVPTMMLAERFVAGWLGSA